MNQQPDKPAPAGGSAAARRPIAARDSQWAPRVSRRLIAMGLTPNQISALSVAFALIAALALGGSAEFDGWLRAGLLLSAAIGIQLRLLCNLFDGMMAVEGGLKSPVGDIYNDFPDRLADPLILIAAGCASRHLDWAMTLGWLAALLSLMTAYVRMLGAASGLPHDYAGPMAKQHRMAVLTIACIASMFDPLWSDRFGAGQILRIALAVIVAGSIVTVVRRTAHIARGLRDRARESAA